MAYPQQANTIQRMVEGREANKGKWALNTGAGGLVGSTLNTLLLLAGYSVRTTDVKRWNTRWFNETKKFMEGHPKLFEGQMLEFVEADLSQQREAMELIHDIRISVLLHSAAIFNMKAPWAVLEQVNVEGTRNLLDGLIRCCALEEKHGIVVWSSGNTYGSVDTLEPISEAAQRNPVNLYSASKWMQEKLALSYSNRFSVAALLPGLVYGPRGVYAAAEMIKATAQGLMAVYPINRPGEGRASLVNVDDVAGAGLFLAQQLAEGKVKNGGAFNVADDTPHFIRDLVVMLCRKLRMPEPFLPIHKKIAEIAMGTMPEVLDFFGFNESMMSTVFGKNNSFSNRKLKEAGYEFKYPASAEGLEATLKWCVENGFLLPETWKWMHMAARPFYWNYYSISDAWKLQLADAQNWAPGLLAA